MTEYTLQFEVEHDDKHRLREVARRLGVVCALEYGLDFDWNIEEKEYDQ